MGEYSVTTERGINDTIKIVDAIKAKGVDGRILTSAMISTLTGLTQARVKGLLKEEMKINNNIISIPRKGYQWIVPEKKIERYNDTKNDEGYTDMTAFLAMQNVIDDRYKQEPGQIWEYDGNPYNDNPNWVVILKPYGHPDKGSNSVLYVNRIDDQFFDARYCISFRIKDKEYYVDPRRIQQRPTKSLSRSKYRLDDEVFGVIKDNVAKHLDILTRVEKEIVEVEVPSEPIVKVEEVIKEVPAQITEGDAIAFLEKSGWLEKHDNEISVTEREIANDVSSSTVNVLRQQYLEAAAARDAYREALHLMAGKDWVID